MHTGTLGKSNGEFFVASLTELTSDWCRQLHLALRSSSPISKRRLLSPNVGIAILMWAGGLPLHPRTDTISPLHTAVFCWQHKAVLLMSFVSDLYSILRVVARS